MVFYLNALLEVFQILPEGAHHTFSLRSLNYDVVLPTSEIEKRRRQMPSSLVLREQSSNYESNCLRRFFYEGNLHEIAIVDSPTKAIEIGLSS